MELGVQHVMGNAVLLQHRAQFLRLGDGGGTNQHRLALGMDFRHLLAHSLILGLLGLVNEVRMVDALHRLVGRHHNDRQVVYLQELVFLSLGGTCHAAQLVIHAEVVLEGNGSKSLGLTLNLHALLGLDGLMEAVRITASLHETARELVHDDDFIITYHIVTVPLHQRLGPECCREAVGQLDILRSIEVGNAQHLLNLGHSAVGSCHSLLLLINRVVRALLEPSHSTGHHGVHIRGLLTGTRDDQRGTGLIHQNGIHLVHDGKVQFPLHHLVFIDDHVVAEIVKAKLIVGTESDIAAIGVLALREVHIMGNQAHRKAQELIEPAHPLAVAAGQIVVHRHHVDALASKGVQINCQSCHQGLAFTGAHLGNAALMQAHAANHLHIKVTHAQHTAGSLAGHGKSLGQDIVQGLTISKSFLELSCITSQLVIRQILHSRFQAVDLLHNLPVPGYFFIVIVT